MPTAKKSTKKPASKSVVGGLKSKPKWKVGFLVLAALLLVSSVGYVGYRKIKLHNLEAHAQSWTVLTYGGSHNVSVSRALACKTAVSGGYGNLYKINFQVTRYSEPVHYLLPTKIGINVYSNKYTDVSQQTQDQWLYGAVAGTTAYVSRDLNQKITLWIGAGSAKVYPTPYINESSPFNPAELANC